MAARRCTRARGCVCRERRAHPRLAPADPAPEARAARLSRPGRQCRHRARVHDLSQHVPRGLGLRVSQSHQGDALQRRLRAAGHHRDRAADQAHPQLDGRSRHERRKLQGRVQPRPARDQLSIWRRAERLRRHSIYKFGAREIAAQEGMAITFMAKFDQREGSSCHVHLSLAGADGSNAFAGDQQLFDRFLAGQLTALRELTLLFAPQINSYKRYVPGMFAPSAVAWGQDNRTCAMRVIGHGQGLHIENRLPGADVNPYLAVAAMIAAGLHGVDAALKLEPATVGSAYEGSHPHVPHTMAAARDLFAGSDIARQAFGEDVVEHYVHRADIELAAFDSSITDWERFRGFERL